MRVCVYVLAADVQWQFSSQTKVGTETEPHLQDVFCGQDK